MADPENPNPPNISMHHAGEAPPFTGPPVRPQDGSGPRPLFEQVNGVAHVLANPYSYADEDLQAAIDAGKKAKDPALKRLAGQRERARAAVEAAKTGDPKLIYEAMDIMNETKRMADEVMDAPGHAPEGGGPPQTISAETMPPLRPPTPGEPGAPTAPPAPRPGTPLVRAEPLVPSPAAAMQPPPPPTDPSSATVRPPRRPARTQRPPEPRNPPRGS